MLRLTKKTFSNGDASISYFYDQTSYNGLTIANGIGRRTGMSDAAGTEAWSYDAMGRALADRRTTNSVTKTTSYTYNLDGSPAMLTYPSNRTITYTPNAAGRLVSGVDTGNSINYALNALYAPQGALAYVQNGASLYSTFLFDKRLHPCWIYATTSSTGAPTTCAQTGVAMAAVLDFQYDFGLGVADNGNVNKITNRRNTGRSVTYTYDELNRIKSAVTDSTSGQYCWGQLFGSMVGGNYVSGYDIWANLKTITPDPSRPGCGVNTLGLTIGNFNKIVDSGFSYDAAGNLTATPNPGGLAMQYDAENHMTTVAGVTYTYDGDGKRMKKSSGKLYWYGMGSDPLTETDLSGTPTAEYIFFNGKRTARLDLPGAAVHYYFSDHLGSASVITSSTGAIQDESDYYPFGGERVITDSDPNQYKFTGKERDSETNLDYFGARVLLQRPGTMDFARSEGHRSSPLDESAKAE